MEIKQVIYKECTKTLKRQGKCSTDEHKCHGNTIKNNMLDAESFSSNGQLKTTARMAAEDDPRTALTMHAMCIACCEKLHPQMIFNWDATQFKVSDDTNLLLASNKVERANRLPVTRDCAGTTSVFVKLYRVTSTTPLATLLHMFILLQMNQCQKMNMDWLQTILLAWVIPVMWAITVLHML